MRIILPWPDKRLSQNARVHWAQRRAETYQHRQYAWAVVTAYHGRWWADTSEHAPTLRFTYHPPDKRRRDAQNMPAMLKAYIDGIADALGVDDSTFECIFPSKFAEPVKGGQIVVDIE